MALSAVINGHATHYQAAAYLNIANSTSDRRLHHLPSNADLWRSSSGRAIERSHGAPVYDSHARCVDNNQRAICRHDFNNPASYDHDHYANDHNFINGNFVNDRARTDEYQYEPDD